MTPEPKLTIFDTQPTIVPSTLAMGSRIASRGERSGMIALSRLTTGGSRASISCISGGSSGMMTLLTICRATSSSGVMTGSSEAIRFASTGSTVEMICVSIGSTVARMLAIGGRIA